MVGPLGEILDLAVTGVSHRTGGVGLRDRLFIEDHEIGSVTAQLKQQGAKGVLILSTCDRVEIAVTGSIGKGMMYGVREALQEKAQGDESFASSLYQLTGEEACRHLFRIAASLESQVVGEPQVLGQVKAAHRMARENGAMPADFDALLQSAYAAAKKVRTETRIGERPVSIATAAGSVARDVHGDLSAVCAVMIGGGDMGLIAAEHLISRGIKNLTVLHDRPKRAEAVAERLGCHSGELASLSDRMGDGDIVISALGRRGYAITSDMVRTALGQRRHRPMLLLDLAVPGDVDPSIDRLDDAYLFDMANLDAIAADGSHSREAELPAASTIVEDHLAAYIGANVEREAVPALTRLRHRVEQLRDQALDEAGGDAEKATRLLAARVLHGPSVNLKAIARDEGPEAVAAAERLLEKLFDQPASRTRDDGDKNEY